MTEKTIAFIEKAKMVHNETYSYTNVEYVNNYSKVIITCAIHGNFEQQPKEHIKGAGCPKCAKSVSGKKIQAKYSIGTDKFIAKAKLIHGEKYDYTNVNYVNALTQVDIVCPVHGVFSQRPDAHLKGAGCGLCYHKKSILKRRA